MRLCFPILALLALAGCAQTRHVTLSYPVPAAPLADTRTDAVQLKPVDLASFAPDKPKLLTVDGWLDDYFTVLRDFEERERRAALAIHPEWLPQIEALRQLESENERMARFVFLYYYRTGKGQIHWSQGNWLASVLPCNCGRIHQVDIPEWESHFRALSEARAAATKIVDEGFQSAYALIARDLRKSLWPDWEAQMVRLKPGFLRFAQKMGGKAEEH